MTKPPCRPNADPVVEDLGVLAIRVVTGRLLAVLMAAHAKAPEVSALHQSLYRPNRSV